MNLKLCKGDRQVGTRIDAARTGARPYRTFNWIRLDHALTAWLNRRGWLSALEVFNASQHGGCHVKTLATMAALAFCCLAPASAFATGALNAGAMLRFYPDLAPLPSYATVQHALLPQLPEPEVVAMMILGLILIGYRASRENNDTFR